MNSSNYILLIQDTPVPKMMFNNESTQHLVSSSTSVSNSTADIFFVYVGLILKIVNISSFWTLKVLNEFDSHFSILRLCIPEIKIERYIIYNL